MFCSKKSMPGESREEKPVDFPWLRYIGMNRLGFTYTQSGHLYFYEWFDLFDAFKQQYNFEANRMLYKVGAEEREEKISSLDEI